MCRDESLDRSGSVDSKPPDVDERRRSSLALACPPPPATAEVGVIPFSFEVSGASESPLHVIGLELRVAFATIGSGDIEAGDNDFWLRKCRELMLRPATEPLLLARWAKLKSFEISEAEMASFCSLLCGSRQLARTRDSHGLWDGGNVRFEPAELARTWWRDIQSAASRPELAPLLPAYCFARTIIAHPYPDGNGRLARALVHAALTRTQGLKGPVLPLAPAFYKNRAKVAAALRALSANGDWDRFNAVFQVALKDAVALARQADPSG
jgi:hypothetical protein